MRPWSAPWRCCLTGPAAACATRLAAVGGSRGPRQGQRGRAVLLLAVWIVRDRAGADRRPAAGHGGVAAARISRRRLGRRADAQSAGAGAARWRRSTRRTRRPRPSSAAPRICASPIRSAVRIGLREGSLPDLMASHPPMAEPHRRAAADGVSGMMARRSRVATREAHQSVRPKAGSGRAQRAGAGAAAALRRRVHLLLRFREGVVAARRDAARRPVVVVAGSSHAVSRWYLERLMPGAPVFARSVPLGAMLGGLALTLGFWTRLAAARCARDGAEPSARAPARCSGSPISPMRRAAAGGRAAGADDRRRGWAESEKIASRN